MWCISDVCALNVHKHRALNWRRTERFQPQLFHQIINRFDGRITRGWQNPTTRTHTYGYVHIRDYVTENFRNQNPVCRMCRICVVAFGNVRRLNRMISKIPAASVVFVFVVVIRIECVTSGLRYSHIGHSQRISAFGHEHAAVRPPITSN